MSNRRHHESMNDQEAIRQSLESSGFDGSSLTGNMSEAFRDEIEQVLSYIEEGRDVIVHRNVVDEFGETEDSIQRLYLLKDMSTADAVECVRRHGSLGGKRYVEKRLQFYKDLLEGKSEKPADSGYGYGRREGATPDSVKVGLLRDIMKAAMIGTPEMAIYRIAEKRAKATKGNTYNLPLLTGYHSGIFPGGQSVGGYDDLRRLYDSARRYVETQRRRPDMTTEQIEHRAVMTGAEWLQKSLEYNPGRGPGSPYLGSFDEQIAWARLGSQTQRQLKGMRQKIMSSDLHGIGRFIGKSGDNRYAAEARRLEKLLEEARKDHNFELIQSTRSQPAQVSTENETKTPASNSLWGVPLNSQEKVSAQETPDEPEAAEAQTEQVVLRGADAVVELERRLEIAKRRCEGKKSLAQRALDLHFRVNHTGGRRKSRRGGYGSRNDDDDVKQPAWYAGLVDWINSAPFGTIKRSHTALQRGVSEETTVTLAIAEMILGRGFDKASYEQVQELVKKAADDNESRQALESCLRLAPVLSRHGKTLPFPHLQQLSRQYADYNRIAEEFTVEEMKLLLDSGANLGVALEVRDTMRKAGLNVPLQEIAEHAKDRLDSLEDALQKFGWEDLKFLISKKAYLPAACRLRDYEKQKHQFIPLPEIAEIAHNVSGHHLFHDFDNGLNALPLEQVKALSDHHVSYSDFNRMGEALEKHGHHWSFEERLTFAGEASQYYQFAYYLDAALGSFSLDEIRTLVREKANFSTLTSLRDTLKKKNVTATLEELSLLSRNCSQWNLESALNKFSWNFIKWLLDEEPSNSDLLDRRVRTLSNTSKSESSLMQEFAEAQTEGFSSEDVKQLIDSGSNFESILTVKRVSKKTGIAFTTQDVADIASHDVDGLEEALARFDVKGVRTLLARSIRLPLACAVFDNAKRHSRSMTVEQIADVTADVRSYSDFINALSTLTIEQAQSLSQKGVSNEDWEKVTYTLAQKGHILQFERQLAIVSRLTENHKLGYLEGALNVFSVEEVEQILQRNGDLKNALSTRDILIQRSIPHTFEEILAFVPVGHYSELGDALDILTWDELKAAQAKHAALELRVSDIVKKEIEPIMQHFKGRNEYASTTISNIKRTRQAGFTFGELREYPQLVSSLAGT